MTIINGYATLAEFKVWATSRSGTVTTDAVDDTAAEAILEGVSRYFDQETARHYYPLRQVALYDIPNFLTRYRDELQLTDDLLSLTKLTNGDGTEITSSDYILKSVNNPPYWAIKLRDMTNVTWEPDSNSSSEQVISVDGIWGYHNEYATRAWSLGDTLKAAITDTTGLTFTTVLSGNILAGQIVKIDTEFFSVASVSQTSGGDTVTVVARGDNGTTAATHIISTKIYIWNVMRTVKNAVLSIAQSVYKNRSGQASQGKVTITAAGVVIRPEDVPPMAQKLIYDLRRMS